MLHPLGSVPGRWHKVTGNTILSLFLNFKWHRSRWEKKTGHTYVATVLKNYIDLVQNTLIMHTKQNKKAVGGICTDGEQLIALLER